MQQPVELQNHWVEEVLGIAYPPLQLQQLPQELVSYSPSGIGEVLFLLDSAGLAPGRTLVDLGSGLGKVVLLTTLLSGATAMACGFGAVMFLMFAWANGFNRWLPQFFIFGGLSLALGLANRYFARRWFAKVQVWSAERAALLDEIESLRSRGQD